mmetsp:Transcript_77610/g.227577  ORF Transcript_77610/g.227577 Transcript_77610/m.227577 type:complete len:299 (+) Transcript_77610:978-1874(+)
MQRRGSLPVAGVDVGAVPKQKPRCAARIADRSGMKRAIGGRVSILHVRVCLVSEQDPHASLVAHQGCCVEGRVAVAPPQIGVCAKPQKEEQALLGHVGGGVLQEVGQLEPFWVVCNHDRQGTPAVALASKNSHVLDGLRKEVAVLAEVVVACKPLRHAHGRPLVAAVRVARPRDGPLAVVALAASWEVVLLEGVVLLRMRGGARGRGLPPRVPRSPAARALPLPGGRLRALGEVILQFVVLQRLLRAARVVSHHCLPQLARGICCAEVVLGAGSIEDLFKPASICEVPPSGEVARGVV